MRSIERWIHVDDLQTISAEGVVRVYRCESAALTPVVVFSTRNIYCIDAVWRFPGSIALRDSLVHTRSKAI